MAENGQNESKSSLEYDLINEYEKYFLQILSEYGRKGPSMVEKGLDYLSKYTRLLET